MRRYLPLVCCVIVVLALWVEHWIGAQYRALLLETAARCGTATCLEGERVCREVVLPLQKNTTNPPTMLHCQKCVGGVWVPENSAFPL